MKTYTKLTEPFEFWLVQQFLPVDENQEDDTRPISDHEFYSTLGMTIGALVIFGIVTHAFGA